MRGKTFSGKVPIIFRWWMIVEGRVPCELTSELPLRVEGGDGGGGGCGGEAGKGRGGEAFVGPLGTVWGPRVASFGLLGGVLGPLGGFWGARWRSRESSWGGGRQMSVLIIPLGPLLGPSWGSLGPSWALLGPSWSPLGPSWGPLGGLLGRLGAILGISWTVFGSVQTKKANMLEI